MGEVMDSLMAETKKIGRILALIIVLGVTGGLSIMMAVSGTADMSVLLDKWMSIAIIAVMFYFTTAKPVPPVT